MRHHHDADDVQRPLQLERDFQHSLGRRPDRVDRRYVPLGPVQQALGAAQRRVREADAVAPLAKDVTPGRGGPTPVGVDLGPDGGERQQDGGLEAPDAVEGEHGPGAGDVRDQQAGEEGDHEHPKALEQLFLLRGHLRLLLAPCETPVPNEARAQCLQAERDRQRHGVGVQRRRRRYGGLWIALRHLGQLQVPSAESLCLSPPYEFVARE